MQLVCLCVRYTVRGANIWTDRGVLGPYRHINTWTAAESGDSKHSSFINIQKCIQLLLCLSLVCVTVWVLCYSMQDKELHVLFYNDRLMSFVSSTHLFQGVFILMTSKVSYVQIFFQLSLHKFDSHVFRLWASWLCYRRVCVCGPKTQSPPWCAAAKLWRGKTCMIVIFRFSF